MDQQKPLLLESGMIWLSKKAREFRVPLLASVLFGLLAYGFNLTNKLINHDEAASLFIKGGALGSGRWGLNFLEFIFPNVSMPWIYGLMTLAFIAVAVCIICHLFEIRRPLTQILLAGGIMVFPSLTGTMAYMFTSNSFALSFLLAVTAVLLIRTPTKWTVVPALGCMVFSLGIYQSYISLAAGLLVLLLIRQLLMDAEVNDVFRRGILYLAFLAVSLAGYLIATRVLLRLTGTGFNSYASENLNVRLGDLPGRFALAYGNFFRFFRDGYCGLIPTSLSRWMHWILMAGTLVLLVLRTAALPRKELPRLLLLAALLGILPLALNCMYLITTEDAVHTLVLYGFVTVYVLCAVAAEFPVSKAMPRRLALEAMSFAMAVILSSNIYVANAASLNLYLRYENAFSFYTALAADIKQMPQFDQNTKLAVTGQYRSPDFFYEHFANESQLTGTAGFFPDNYSKNFFVEYYTGFPIPFASEEEIAAVTATAEYEAMPCYPYYGSMQFFGDILIVKLS